MWTRKGSFGTSAREVSWQQPYRHPPLGACGSGGRADDANGLHLISRVTMDPSPNRTCWGELPHGVAIVRRE